MSDHIAEARKMVGRPQIREIFLRNGARIEPERDDLPDWVYESAFELLELAAPAVQGEPVAWMTGKVCGGDATLNTVNVELDAPPLWGDLPLGTRVSLQARSEQSAEQQATGHDWDDQDKCRRCGDRDWYASATCTPKQQPAPDAKGEPAACANCHGAQLAEQHPCPICFEDEPHTGVCGSSDPKALCNREPAYQQPAPDVAGLVEALEQIEQWVKRWCADGHPIAKFAGAALAAHRSQGGGRA